uniref:Uncharacterized protein n=1 Tax=Rhizophora mucronata TaxID=61149 RepID=A0A2P2NJN1_RHIMU
MMDLLELTVVSCNLLLQSGAVFLLNKK